MNVHVSNIPAGCHIHSIIKDLISTPTLHQIHKQEYGHMNMFMELTGSSYEARLVGH